MQENQVYKGPGSRVGKPLTDAERDSIKQFYAWVWGAADSGLLSRVVDHAHPDIYMKLHSLFLQFENGKG